MSTRYKPRPAIDSPEVATALAAMPERFQNVHFRGALGVTPFDASEMLATLQVKGRVAHPGGHPKWWIATTPYKEQR